MRHVMANLRPSRAGRKTKGLLLCPKRTYCGPGEAEMKPGSGVLRPERT